MLYEVITFSGKGLRAIWIIYRINRRIQAFIGLFSNPRPAGNFSISSLTIFFFFASVVITSYSIHYTKLYDCQQFATHLRTSTVLNNDCNVHTEAVIGIIAVCFREDGIV